MARYRVLVDIAGGTELTWESTLNELAALSQELATEGVEVHVLVHSRAWPLVANKAKVSVSEPQQQAEALARRGVRFVLCENTMHGANLRKRDLLPFVKTVPSAIGELVKKQTEGWAYLRYN
jgi:uncharacterized protein